MTSIFSRRNLPNKRKYLKTNIYNANIGSNGKNGKIDDKNANKEKHRNNDELLSSVRLDPLSTIKYDKPNLNSPPLNDTKSDHINLSLPRHGSGSRGFVSANSEALSKKLKLLSTAMTEVVNPVICPISDVRSSSEHSYGPHEFISSTGNRSESIASRPFNLKESVNSQDFKFVSDKFNSGNRNPLDGSLSNGKMKNDKVNNGKVNNDRFINKSKSISSESSDSDISSSDSSDSSDDDNSSKSTGKLDKSYLDNKRIADQINKIRLLCRIIQEPDDKYKEIRKKVMDSRIKNDELEKRILDLDIPLEDKIYVYEQYKEWLESRDIKTKYWLDKVLQIPRTIKPFCFNSSSISSSFASSIIQSSSTSTIQSSSISSIIQSTTSSSSPLTTTSTIQSSSASSTTSAPASNSSLSTSLFLPLSSSSTLALPLPSPSTEALTIGLKLPEKTGLKLPETIGLKTNPKISRIIVPSTQQTSDQSQTPLNKSNVTNRETTSINKNRETTSINKNRETTKVPISSARKIIIKPRTNAIISQDKNEVSKSSTSDGIVKSNTSGIVKSSTSEIIKPKSATEVAIIPISSTQVVQQLAYIKYVLDSRLYGMKKEKEEIMVHLNNVLTNPKNKSLNLGLVGNPGVGKTELIRTLASALNIPFAQISLGGAHDSSYLDGHAFTWHGSRPGAIVSSLISMGCKNGIIYFDELDKIEDTQKGKEVAWSLLHILDPTQNMEYKDKYIDPVKVDLSHIWFMFSMNDEKRVERALLDRIHIVRVGDQSRKDKVKMLKKIIVPRLLKENNLDHDHVLIPDKTLEYLVSERCAAGEAGARGLIRSLTIIFRRICVLKNCKMADSSICKLDFSFNIEGLSFPLVVSIDVLEKLLPSGNGNECVDNEKFIGIYI